MLFSCRLTEHSGAAGTPCPLCAAEHSGDSTASWALRVHEAGPGALHRALLLAFPRLLFWRGMEEDLGETRVLVRRLSAPERRVFNFNEVQLISSFLHGSCLWCCIQKWLPSPRPPRCSSVLAPRSLTVLQFTFGSGIHFESALVTCVRSGPDSFFHVRMSICSSTSC